MFNDGKFRDTVHNFVPQILEFNIVQRVNDYDCWNLYFNPYSSNLQYNVVRPIPSSSAATLRFPFACFKACRILSFSSTSLRRVKQTEEDCFVTSSSRCSFVTTPVCACNTAPLIFCRSSRTLPDHVWVSNVLRAPRQIL